METQHVTGNDKAEDVTIVVNGQEHEVPKNQDITFEQVVQLSGLQSGPNVVFTVTYRKGDQPKEGSLTPGGEVKVKDGMIFNVTATDKS